MSFCRRSLCAGKHHRLSSGEQKELGEKPGRAWRHGPSTVLWQTRHEGLLPGPGDLILLRPLQAGRKLTSAEILWTGDKTLPSHSAN